MTEFRLPPNPPKMVPSNLVGAAAFTTDVHTETIHKVFATPDNHVQVGVWECAPCREEIAAYPVHEMMTVVPGSVTLTHPDGRAEAFNATNHPNWANPNTSLVSTNFGRITGTRTNMRELQFGVKFLF